VAHLGSHLKKNKQQQLIRSKAKKQQLISKLQYRFKLVDMHDFGRFPAFTSDEICGVINFLNDLTLSLVKRLPLGRPTHNSTGVVNTNSGPLLKVSWPGLIVAPPARAVSCSLQVVPNQCIGFIKPLNDFSSVLWHSKRALW